MRPVHGDPCGPSPRARGAGSSPFHPAAEAKDHPRVRGEQSSSSLTGRGTDGPSPRARGAGCLHRHRPLQLRTIPACAGSRNSRSRARATARDHPRVRGEQEACALGANAVGGPSPRARGAAARGAAHRGAQGTIPACAGSRSRQRHASRPEPDHPRVRGEQPTLGSQFQSARGPSPRARGADRNRRRRTRGGRTIPACAGSRTSIRTTRKTSWDHPRVRGEQFRHDSKTTFRQGPSPRARGAVPPVPGRAGRRGTIPACAGSSVNDRYDANRSEDHPRVRGEQTGRRAAIPNHEGPSPRARGAVALNLRTVERARTIPACAGSR